MKLAAIFLFLALLACDDHKNSGQVTNAAKIKAQLADKKMRDQELIEAAQKCYRFSRSSLIDQDQVWSLERKLKSQRTTGEAQLAAIKLTDAKAALEKSNLNYQQALKELESLKGGKDYGQKITEYRKAYVDLVFAEIKEGYSSPRGEEIFQEKARMVKMNIEDLGEQSYWRP